jgi:hypothetical protein
MFHAVFRLEDIWSKRVGARDTPDIDSCSTMRLQDVRHGADSCGCGDDIIDNGDMPMTDLGNLTASHKDAPHILAPLGGIEAALSVSAGTSVTGVPQNRNCTSPGDAAGQHGGLIKPSLSQAARM